MEEKTKKIVRWVLLSLGVVVAVAAVAGVLYWNRMLNMLGDAEQTVPTLSQEEEAALLGTEETIAETEPKETWPQIVSDKNITNIMLVGQNWREDEQN